MSKWEKYLVPAEERVESFIHEGDVFTFRGKRSGSVIERAALPPEKSKARAEHFAQVVGGPKLNADEVFAVALMNTWLDRSDGATIGETDFARLRETDYALFGKCAKAVMAIGGFGETTRNEEGQEVPLGTVTVTGLGNSSAEAPTEPPSSPRSTARSKSTANGS